MSSTILDRRRGPWGGEKTWKTEQGSKIGKVLTKSRGDTDLKEKEITDFILVEITWPKRYNGRKMEGKGSNEKLWKKILE